MFVFIRHILLMLMGCVITSCGNDIAFEHPTEEDLMKARAEQGLPAKTFPSKTHEAKQPTPLDTLASSLTPEQNAQRNEFIRVNVDDGMRQISEQFSKTNITFSDADLSELKRLAEEYFLGKWNIDNLSDKLSPATLITVKEENLKLQEALAEEAQRAVLDVIRSKGGIQGKSEIGTRQYSVNGNLQNNAGPEISLSEIIPAEQSIETQEHLKNQHRLALQKQMDEAEITLTSSEIDDLLRLQEAMTKASQRTQEAYKLRSQGKNISHETFEELNRQQSSISQKITKITAPLQEAILVKREPEMRRKQIENMKHQYERQSKFPSSYDLEQLYENQKSQRELRQEYSKIMQQHQNSAQVSTNPPKELIKSYTEKRKELQRQRREIEARIR